MLFLAYIPALGFVVLAGYANVLFAMQLSDAQHVQLFWIGLAIASTLYTVTGLSVFAAQVRGERRARALAALALLGLAISYDALAAYALTRAEQEAATATVAAKQRAIASADDRLSRLQADLAKVQDAPPAEVAKAFAAGARKAADKASAAEGLAKAVARDRLLVELQEAQRARDALPPAVADARGELLPRQLVAWGPVLLVTLGAILGLFSLERPAPVRREPAPPAKRPEPVSAPPATPEPVQDAETRQSADLIQLYRAPPASLVVDKDGWLRGTQRAIASALGVGPAKLNRILHKAASERSIDLDTGAGTAYRPRA